MNWACTTRRANRRSEFLSLQDPLICWRTVKSPDPNPILKSAPFCALFCVVSIVTIQILSAQVQARNSLPLSVIVVDSASQAQGILDQLKNGGDFAAIARQKSINATASDGGFMGRLEPRTLRVEVREALNGVKTGALTGIVKIPEGYAILKVLPESEVPSVQTTNPANPTRLLPLLATGAVKYTLSVSGGDEAELVFRDGKS